MPVSFFSTFFVAKFGPDVSSTPNVLFTLSNGTDAREERLREIEN
jgi:hypothetical protein